DRSRFVVEPNSQGLVLPGILEHVAAVGGKDQIEAQSFSGFAERARLVPGGRGKEEDSHQNLSTLDLRPWTLAGHSPRTGKAKDEGLRTSLHKSELLRIRLGAAVPGFIHMGHRLRAVRKRLRRTCDAGARMGQRGDRRK